MLLVRLWSIVDTITDFIIIAASDLGPSSPGFEHTTEAILIVSLLETETPRLAAAARNS